MLTERNTVIRACPNTPATRRASAILSLLQRDEFGPSVLRVVNAGREATENERRTLNMVCEHAWIEETEYVSGGTLATRKPRDAEQVRRYLDSLRRLLRVAHQELGFEHNAICAENIAIRDADDTPVLINFERASVLVTANQVERSAYTDECSLAMTLLRWCLHDARALLGGDGLSYARSAVLTPRSAHALTRERRIRLIRAQLEVPRVERCVEWVCAQCLREAHQRVCPCCGEFFCCTECQVQRHFG